MSQKAASPTTLARLASLAQQLPPQLHPLEGRHAPDLALPDNILCFCRSSASEINRPPDGRALHHRHVLILALETAVTVCVDNQVIRLRAGQGLLVLPFQFHNYIHPANEKITWMFVTFETPDGRSLEALRFCTFALTPVLRRLIDDLLRAYLAPKEEDLTLLIFAVLLARIRHGELLHRCHNTPEEVPDIVMKINHLAQSKGDMPSLRDMARALGISTSHLRARFRSSCGVSIGRHLRRMHMEKACGLLRHSTQRVSEIAEQCGFASIFSFSRAFSNAYGVSPLRYRHHGRAQPRGLPALLISEPVQAIAFPTRPARQTKVV